MGISKTKHFTDKQNKMAALFKALGHPARIAIVEYLIRIDSCVCGDIVNELPLAQATISQHLKELKEAGWIKGTIEGNKTCYCIDERALETLQGYCSSIATKLENRNNCC
jgi:DNA-binding transcriptional ArsR family regulator